MDDCPLVKAAKMPAVWTTSYETYTTVLLIKKIILHCQIIHIHPFLFFPLQELMLFPPSLPLLWHIFLFFDFFISVISICWIELLMFFPNFWECLMTRKPRRFMMKICWVGLLIVHCVCRNVHQIWRSHWTKHILLITLEICKWLPCLLPLRVKIILANTSSQIAIWYVLPS